MGPDLSGTGQRHSRAWFERWLRDPAGQQPMATCHVSTCRRRRRTAGRLPRVAAVTRSVPGCGGRTCLARTPLPSHAAIAALPGVERRILVHDGKDSWRIDEGIKVFSPSRFNDELAKGL